MRASPDMANGGSGPQSTNGARRGSRKYNLADPDITGYEDDMDREPSAAEVSYQRPAPKATPGQKGRSFSARAGNQPAANLNYTTRKPVPDMPPGISEESTTPRGLPPAEYSPELDAAIQSQENVHSSAPISPGQPSPLSRSNTTQSTAGKQRNWASDRSPLQKLEVTLNGISKEEKRARVQEAEMRVRERLARQKAEREKAESTAIVPPPSQLPESRAASGPPRKTERKETIMGDIPRDAPMPRQPEGLAMRHNRNVSTKTQYPAIQRPEDAQYAQAEVAVPVSTQVGSVPRRSVTMSGPAAKPGPAGGRPPNRSVSQSKAVRSAAVAAEEERVEAPPAVRIARAAQESVESHQKPKREKQTVSFNVPPPTPPPVFEWKNSPAAHLGAADFDFQHLDITRSKAWWEGGGTKDRRKSRALPKNYQTPAQKLTGKTTSWVKFR